MTEDFDSRLAPYASDPLHSRGRLIPEQPAPTRNDFQRDRDRIVHSSAFRRLVYKTQVFLNHEGDLFRTRLTHSLEVAQLARSMARSLGLHEDLVEAIALAHDLGHTPFGHAGQDALNQCMIDFGGFEHNLQSLRVVDFLEERYALFDGLNLTFETREGILKHCGLAQARELQAREPGGVGARFIDRTQPSLEAQLCNLADEIAYNAHDIDDGVRSGLLSTEQLRQSVPWFEHYCSKTLSLYPKIQGRRWLFETIRLMLSEQVYDVIETTRAALAPLHLMSANEARAHPGPLVMFSEPMQEASSALKQFLSANLYRHPRVLYTTEQAKEIIKDLFLAYLHTPSEMPESFHARHDRERAVADYIAGMTDRFAAKEHQRLSRWSPSKAGGELPLDHQPGLGFGRASAGKEEWVGLPPKGSWLSSDDAINDSNASKLNSKLNTRPNSNSNLDGNLNSRPNSGLLPPADPSQPSPTGDSP